MHTPMAIWGPNHVSEQFTQFYYNTFDENRKNLAALYVRLSKGYYHLLKWHGLILASAINRC